MSTMSKHYLTPEEAEHANGINHLKVVKQRVMKSGDVSLITDLGTDVLISVQPKGGDYKSQKFPASKSGFSNAVRFLENAFCSRRPKDKEVRLLPLLTARA